jgi:PAS domain S-box-containing protein
MLLNFLLVAVLLAALAIAIVHCLHAPLMREREWQEWFRGTLRALESAVITTDPHGRITLMNAAAEKLTAWREADAIGRPIASVFRLVDEWTRGPVVNPTSKAFYRNAIVGPSTGTLLLAKDGRTQRIDERAAPLRDEQGRAFGSLLIFRPIAG